MPVVAFQGEPGAFSDDAARTLVPGSETLGFGTFDDAFGAVASGRVDFAAMPVENSISGPVPRVYDLLWDEPRVTIAGELVYRVVQNLIGIGAATETSLRDVRSHPVALEQCRKFFAAHPYLHSTIVADTAGAVREIVALGDAHSAAIGSALAAERYGARIITPNIQDVDANFTRFFLVRRDAPEASEPSRACVALSLAHRPGSLRDALSSFADANFNLRTLVSRPSPEEPFTYRFYCEMSPVTRADLARVLSHIDGTARILGLY